LADWPQYLGLGIPGAVIHGLQWVGFEMLVIMAGWLGQAEVSAMALACYGIMVVYSFSIGINITISVLVGNNIGANLP
jgi:Na+-driven multidrug efflux pump